ncbi:hypothetical protein VNI00_008018 [Paramarasmius palmivorus]|uniref:Major facilitator superfamily (MFS) profile domain-containing protein n=1 Tax=Paramarasmius palmivorus TaxID=297713 RepID=A0AAW0CY50_9AGAR
MDMQNKNHASWSNNTHPQWYRDPGLRKNVIWVGLMYFGVFTFGYDGTVLNGLQSLPQWNQYFGNPSGATLGLINASLFFPVIVFAPLAAWFNDRFGRRISIVIGSLGIIAGSLLSSFGTNQTMFMAGRAVMGAFTVSSHTGTVCLANELAHPRLRGIAGALYNTTSHVGGMTAAWLCFATVSWNSNWAWRIPVLCQGFGPSILFVSALFCPESPRWLVSQGKLEEAWNILAKYHANGDRDDELVKRELEEITDTILRVEATASSWASLIKTPGNRRRMVVTTIMALGTVFNGVTIVAFYLVPTLRQVGVTDPIKIGKDLWLSYLMFLVAHIFTAGINGGLSVFNYLMAILGAVCVDSVGRRPLWLLSTSGMLAAYCVITPLAASFEHTPTSPKVANAFIAMLFVYYGFYDIGWTTLPHLYTIEISPYGIRAKATSYFILIQAAALAFTAYVNPIAMEAIGWRYYGIYIGCLGTLLILVWWLFVETKGHTIEQVSVLFD